MDRISAQHRSALMARIRSKNTAPELAVRRYLHAAGFRYRLHHHGLPGRPDLVFAGRRLCVFIHGCFWHGCPHCRHGARQVKSNVPYWSAKLARNKARDLDIRQRLAALGWTAFTIWECQVSDPAALASLVQTIRAVPATTRPSAQGRARSASDAAPSQRAAPPPS